MRLRQRIQQLELATGEKTWVIICRYASGLEPGTFSIEGKPVERLLGEPNDQYETRAFAQVQLGRGATKIIHLAC